MANVTPITPPRVPLLDVNSGVISREWYQFFLSLYRLSGGGSDVMSLQDVQLGPQPADYSNEIAALSGSELEPPAEPIVLPGDPLEPKAQLGTLAAVDEDNVRKIGFATMPSPSVGGPAVGTAWWSQGDDTLTLQHSGGVRQQIGEELYLRIVNNTGVTITNGTVVGFGGVSTGDFIEGVPYIADGTVNSLYAIGVATEDIEDEGTGRVTVWGRVRDIDTTGTPYGETWATGDILYVSPTVAGGLTNIAPTSPDLSIPMGAVLCVHASTGQIFVRPTIEQQMYYGQFEKTVSASVAVINTAYPITIDSTSESNGVSIVSGSRITFDHEGLYSITANIQLSSGSASAKTGRIWWRKNGVDIARSAHLTTMNINGGYRTICIADFFIVEMGDYIELTWAADSTSLTIAAVGATAYAPSAPSITLTVTQIQQ